MAYRIRPQTCPHSADSTHQQYETTNTYGYGSFHGWLQRHHRQPLEDWPWLFKKTFVFTGGQIVGEFLMSLGYLPGAHSEDCPVYAKTQAALARIMHE